MAHTIVIFGASGDLTSRKLVPALYELHRKRRLPEQTRIVGFSRTPFSHQAWREKLPQSTAHFLGGGFDPAVWEEFAPSIFYHPCDIGKAEDFDSLKSYLAELEGDEGATRIYYLATAPQFYQPAMSCCTTQIVIQFRQAPHMMFEEGPRTAHEVELAWGIIDPIPAAWDRPGLPPMEFYEAGGWGPPNSTDWMRRQQREWFDSCPVLK